MSNERLLVRGWKFNSKQCKVCKIFQASPQLFEKIHHMRFVNDISLSNIADYVNDYALEYVDPTGLDMPFPVKNMNKMNLSTHFKEHIYSLDEYLRFNKDIQNTPSLIVFDDDDEVPAEPSHVKASSPKNSEAVVFDDSDVNLFEDYVTIDDHISSFEKMYTTSMNKIHKSGEVLDIMSMDKLANILRTLVELRTKNSSVKKTDEICGNAVNEAVIEVAKSFLSRLSWKVNNLSELLAKNGISEKLVSEITKSLYDDTKTHIMSSAESIVSGIKKKYRITK
jgi:hypothetical protein